MNANEKLKAGDVVYVKFNIKRPFTIDYISLDGEQADIIRVTEPKGKLERYSVHLATLIKNAS